MPEPEMLKLSPGNSGLPGGLSAKPFKELTGKYLKEPWRELDNYIGYRVLY
ncbi:hypothetical protein DCCM_3956 [Desulfocucumis palustris]|uniref:Uncharacterized protein n=1 Tax=Desulfocucumis palustris TaxID=1898651 RepID=A0A2L2XKM5_9FIRM|nr:hypothetical protein DCCM_3956 [Desulfocucumis palustris]